MRFLFLTFLFFLSNLSLANTTINQIIEKHSAVMLLIDGRNGDIVLANNAAANFYGYTKQQLESMKIQSINQFTAAQVAEERKNAEQENRNFFIFRHQLASGDVKTVEVYSVPIIYENRKLLFSIIKDISKQRQFQTDLWQYQSNLEQMVDKQVALIDKKQQKLHTSYLIGLLSLLFLALVLIYLLRLKRIAEKRSQALSQIVEQSPSAIFSLDENGSIIYRNQFACSDLYNRLAPYDANMFELLLADKSIENDLKKALLARSPWVGEVRATGKGDNERWLRLHLYPISLKGSAKKDFVLICDDISQLKYDEKQLRLISTVFQTATEAVMICDKEQKIQTVNDAFTKITGFSQADVIGTQPDVLSAYGNNQQLYQEIQQSLKTALNWQGEVCNRRKNGDVFYEWLSITALLDENKEIEAYVALFSDITKRKKAENKIYYQANYDALTGLANRNLFLDRFNQVLNIAERDESHVSLMFIDLDGFKYINDTFGHSKGDLLLKQTAERLTSTLRKSDTITRLGGDEFAVLISHPDALSNIERVATKIQNAIAEPFMLDNTQGFVSASIGITTFPQDGDDVETLMRKADSAMYKAKANGKNNYQFFTAEMDKKAQQRRAFEAELRQAVTQDEFCVEFQPILNLQSEKIYACEALVRWQHPSKGRLSPFHFIELAEEIGVITEIGQVVLNKACQQAALWQENYSMAPKISVNISAIQFHKSDFITSIENALNASSLCASQLILEITESLLIENDRETNQKLCALTEMGVQFALDDFGTGYSSLSYLKKFPVQKLKIDKSFILDIEKTPENQALTQAIIAMGQSLNLDIIAEGVEEEAQATWLLHAGCYNIQGYWFAKPQAIEDLEKLLYRYNN